MRIQLLTALFLSFITAHSQISEQSFWESGAVKDKYEIKGKHKVLYKHFSPSGILISEGQYFKSRREGIWKQYYPSGKIRAIFNYKKGWEHGIQKIYAETGELISEYNYRHGVKMGNYTLYYYNGHVKERGKYGLSAFRSYIPHPPPTTNSYDTELPGQASMRIGKNIEYFESGKIKCIRYFEAQYDIIVSFNEPSKNNQVQVVLQKQEVPANRWLYFDENKKIIREEIYENGKLIETNQF